MSEKNQTEDVTLDDPKKDVAISIVFQFTETDVNVPTVTNGDDEDCKAESLPNHQGNENTVSLPCPQGQASSIRLTSNL